VDALKRLLESRLVEVAYEADDEQFFALADAGITALNEGSDLGLESGADAAPGELATDPR
jgi:hypothetical protein